MYTSCMGMRQWVQWSNMPHSFPWHSVSSSCTEPYLFISGMMVDATAVGFTTAGFFSAVMFCSRRTLLWGPLAVSSSQARGRGAVSLFRVSHCCCARSSSLCRCCTSRSFLTSVLRWSVCIFLLDSRERLLTEDTNWHFSVQLKSQTLISA